MSTESNKSISEPQRAGDPIDEAINGVGLSAEGEIFVEGGLADIAKRREQKLKDAGTKPTETSQSDGQ